MAQVQTRYELDEAALALQSSVHRIAMRTPIASVIHELDLILTRPRLAWIIGIRDPKTIARWTAIPAPKIRQLDVERRLRTLFEVVTALRSQDDDVTVGNVLWGTSPALPAGSIARAIREDDLRGALDAAHEFLANG